MAFGIKQHVSECVLNLHLLESQRPVQSHPLVIRGTYARTRGTATEYEVPNTYTCQ